MTITRKVFVYILMLCLMFSFVPANAFAQETGYTSDIIEAIGDVDFSATSDADGLLDTQDSSKAAKTKAIVIIPGILGSSLKNTSTNQYIIWRGTL